MEDLMDWLEVKPQKHFDYRFRQTYGEQEMTLIRLCKCKSEYQDKQYGKGCRVFNVTLKGVRCTNCGELIKTDVPKR